MTSSQQQSVDSGGNRISLQWLPWEGQATRNQHGKTPLQACSSLLLGFQKDSRSKSIKVSALPTPCRR
jgi:hypothetical protein